MDIILGSFAEKNLETMNEENLKLFESSFGSILTFLKGVK